MYRVKENIKLEADGREFKKGDDFFRNHVDFDENDRAVVYLTPVNGGDEFKIPLNSFEQLFFKNDTYE